MTDFSARYGTIFRAGLFAGSVALVTGGGTGIGRACAHELAELGAKVVVAARREEPLRQTVEEIRAAGGTATWATVNIREDDEVQALVSGVIEEHGSLDLLVNNAGGQFPSPAERISPNGWRTVIDLNLNGTFLVTRGAYNAWMADHGGVICSVIADMWRGFPYMAHTGAARAGVDNMTKSLAVEWGRSGVRINAVAPGTIYSSGMDTYDESFQTIAARNASKVPAGRVGTESETAAAIAFLLSPAAAFITGTTLQVDGGAALQKSPMVPLEAHREMPPYDGFHLAREIPGHWSPSSEPADVHTDSDGA